MNSRAWSAYIYRWFRQLIKGWSDIINDTSRWAFQEESIDEKNQKDDVRNKSRKPDDLDINRNQD